MCVCVCEGVSWSRGESLFETHEAAVNKVGVLSGRAPRRRLVVVVLLLLQDPGGEGSPPYSSNVLRNAHLGSQREDERERDRDDLCRVSSDRQASRCSTVDTNLPVRFYNNSSNDSRARDAVEGRCGRQPNAMCRCRAILETCGFPAGGPGCDDEIWSTSGSRCLGGTVGG